MAGPSVAAPVHPDAVEWASDNPWYLTESDLAAEAEAEHVRLLQEFPGMSVADNLGRVTTAIRQRYPGRVRDVGFLFDNRRVSFIGPVPLGDIMEVPAARWYPAFISQDGAKSECGADFIWMLALDADPIPVPPRFLALMVDCIDKGGVVQIQGANAWSTQRARDAIVLMCGGAGNA